MLKELENNEKRLQLLISMADCYQKKYTDDALRLMGKALVNIPVDGLERVISELITESKWLPTVSEIVQAWKESKQIEETNIKDLVYAWLRHNTNWNMNAPVAQSLVDEALIGLGHLEGIIRASEL